MAGKNDKSATVREHPQTFQRRWIIIAVMVAVSLAFGLGLVAILRHKLYTENPKFIVDKIDKIEISGFNKLDREKLIKDADIEKLVLKKNLFDISLRTLRANLKKNPLVEDVEIRRILPSRMTIRVTERVPVARLGKAYPAPAKLVDRKGIVMPPVDLNDFKGLPVLAGHPGVLKVKDGDRLDAKLLPVLDLLNYISTDTTFCMALDVKAAFFEENNFIPTVKLVLRQRFPFMDGATVRLPTTEADYKLKLKQLMIIIQDRRERGVEITSVDASLQDNIPVEPRPGFTPAFTVPAAPAEAPAATRPASSSGR
jgi:cell division septal protein FtsQ